jgi:CelD/BcsL family acetyltransferase involved in cellulose biosynthesis
MTILTAGARELAARSVSRAQPYRIEFAADWKQAAARFTDLGPSTPFQHPQWLDAWYGAFAGKGDVEPLIAIVSDAATGEPIALLPLLGIRSGSRYLMTRISNAGKKWSNCSPGRLIIERTMAALHKQGMREFDFSIVNYAYKRRFGVARLPLVDISAALSWRGIPHALRDRAARELRRYPRLAPYVRRALGRPPSREEN